MKGTIIQAGNQLKKENRCQPLSYKSHPTRGASVKRMEKSLQWLNEESFGIL